MRKVGQNTLNSLPPNDKGLTYLQPSDGLKDCRSDEKWEECKRKSCTTCHCQSLCVLCSPATWSSLRPRERQTDGEGGSDEGRGGSCGEKWSGAAIPRRLGNRRLFQRKKYSQWQTPAIVFRQNHMTAKNTTPSLCTETRNRKKQDGKRGKTERRGAFHIEVFRKTQPDHQQFTPLHEGSIHLYPQSPAFWLLWWRDRWGGSFSSWHT